MRRALTGLLLAFVAWLLTIDRDPQVVAPELQGWNLFHYTVGAGFFPELGYWELYPAVLRADRRGDDSLSYVRNLRDLHTYEIVRRDATGTTAELSPERERELAAWVDALEPLEVREGWLNAFRDRGYNPSPTWTAVAGAIVRAVPPTSRRNQVALASLDLFLLGAAVGALALWRSPGAALVWAVSVASFPGLWRRQVGGFLEYDWLVALVIGGVAVSARSPVVAAVALAWATTTRVFPGALVVTMLLPAGFRFLRTRTIDPFERWFVPAFAVAVAGFVGLGFAAGHGAAAWVEFAERITFHAARHATGEQRVGLAHLLTFSGATASSDALRAATLADRGVARVVLGATLAALAAGAALRRRREEALWLGMVVVFALTVSSRYYAAAFLAWPVFAVRGRWMAPAFLALPLVGFVVWRAGWSPYERSLGLEAALLALALARIAELGVRDLRVWRRVRRPPVTPSPAPASPAPPRSR